MRLKNKFFDISVISQCLGYFFVYEDNAVQDVKSLKCEFFN